MVVSLQQCWAICKELIIYKKWLSFQTPNNLVEKLMKLMFLRLLGLMSKKHPCSKFNTENDDYLALQFFENNFD